MGNSFISRFGIKIFVLSVLLLCLGSSCAFANTFYVKKTGLDSNPGTEAKPFKTIQKAINSLTANGDQIWIYPGDYSQSLSAVNLGKNNITMKGIGSGVNVIGNPDTPALYLKNATGWTIDNMYFSSTRANATGYTQVVFILLSGGTTIKNSTITGGSLAKPIYNGLEIMSSPYSKITNNTINAISNYTITISYSAHVLISGNDISNGIASLLYFPQYCDYTTVEDNYFHDKIYPGINEKNTVFINNIINFKWVS